MQAYHQYGVGSRSAFVNYKKGALDSAASDKVYKLLAHGRCGPLRVLRLLPPLRIVAMI